MDSSTGFLIVLFVSVFSAFAVTTVITPFLINRMRDRKLVGIDLNKFEKPKIPEMGGMAIWFGFAFGTMASIFLFSYLHLVQIELIHLLAGFTTVIVVGFVGVFDDLVGWKNGIAQWQHALIPVFAALPLMVAKINNPPIILPLLGKLPAEFQIPFFGIVSFGVFYSIVLVPIGVTGASNATNMLAGFNGIEAGLGLILHITLLSLFLIFGRIEAALLIAPMIGALIAFLRFNWYPAKIFGGDALTLMVGASIAASVILGDMEKIGVLLLMLFFVEFAFKARKKFKAECYGIPQKNGTLKPDPKGGSITHVIMSRGKFTEKQVVLIILGIQAIISAIVFMLAYFKLLL